MQNAYKIERHSFQPGAMSIIQMGEELIGHPSTAINELVKNGYDADAVECNVYFHYSDKYLNSFAVIFDDGNGMDDTTLFGDWLKPSVSVKRKSSDKKSEVFKRQLLGSKGIGRLASMAIGERVTVISRKQGNSEYNWITVNRELFKKDKLLSDIKFPGDKITDFNLIFSDKDYLEERDCIQNNELLAFLNENSLNNFNKGTLIVVEILDKSVIKILNKDFKNQTELLTETDESYKHTDFYKSLAALITPLTLNKDIQKELVKKKIIAHENTLSDNDNAFNVFFGTNLIPDQRKNETDWQKVEPIPVLSVYDYRIYGKVTRQGDVKGYITYKRLPTSHEDKFEITFKEIIDGSLTGSRESSMDLFEKELQNETGEYYFDVRVYDIGESDNLEKLARKAKFENGAKFRSSFKSFQGLRISKNGFGVKPYGEEVEDWVGLSKERVQNPGQNVNTNQILGYVFFYSPENDVLEEKTNREGFLENKAFIQVKNTLSVIFKNLGRRRYNFRVQNGIGRGPTSRHNRPDVDAFLEVINNYGDKRIISFSEKFMKEVSTSLDNLEDSLSFSERLASLGSGIELVYHEMAQPISGLRTTKSSLELKRKKIDPEVLGNFQFDLDALHHATEVLFQLRQSLQPAIGRSRKKKFRPYDTFFKVCNLFKSDLQEFNILIYADERLKDFEITDLEYAFWIAFLNIVNNAVYWLKKVDIKREIRFHSEGNGFVISNSGPLINEEILEYIFNYGVTTRQESNATGLGLAFSRSVLSRNGWEILAANRKNGPAIIIKKT